VSFANLSSRVIVRLALPSLRKHTEGEVQPHFACKRNEALPHAIVTVRTDSGTQGLPELALENPSHLIAFGVATMPSALDITQWPSNGAVHLSVLLASSMWVLTLTIHDDHRWCGTRSAQLVVPPC